MIIFEAEESPLSQILAEEKFYRAKRTISLFRNKREELVKESRDSTGSAILRKEILNY